MPPVTLFRTALIFRPGLAISLIALVLAGCSGGGGGSGSANAAPPPPQNSWQPGVFLDASTFINRCESPRTGIDPTTGSAFVDVQGTTLDENNFLRSYSDDTYLWYDEIIDQDPGLFDDPIEYFDELRTFETIPGTNLPKDPDSFHFTVDTLEFFNATQGGVSAGYGAEWVLLSTVPPRDVRVAYTEPNSPATTGNLERGAIVLAIDGVDIDDNTQAGVDVLNAGLFPDSIGETHDFMVRDPDGTERLVSMTTEQVTNAMVQAEQIIDTPSGKVGYMLFNFFRAPAEEALINAINKLINDAAPDPVADLILDLRYNGGGFGIIANQLSYMIAGSANTAGRTFELIRFNDKHPTTDPVTGQPLLPDPFLDETTGIFDLPAGQPLPSLDLSRVFVLTGGGTCSASELVINGLRGIDVEVIQVGSTTCGKPYGFYETPNCGTSYFTIQLQTTNDKGFGDFALGFQPADIDDGEAQVRGCIVGDDFSKQLGDPAEDRLEVALAYRDGLTCITPVAGSSGSLSKTGTGRNIRDGVVRRALFDANRIRLRR
ncbi:MAG: S41 family peptidase [Woeseiaceae bacterium]|nr:S41 family peptidase [Woeseiaceae bacterium]